MEKSRINCIINRLITGITYRIIDGRLYKLDPPTKETLALSHLVYEEILNNSKFDELITQEQASFFLIKKKIWNPEKEKNLELLNKRSDQLKIQLYKALYNEKDKKNIRKKLASNQKVIEKNLSQKHSLDHMTLENFAEQTRDEFIIANSITYEGENVYNYYNFWNSDSYVLNGFMNYLSKTFVKTEEYRYLARKEPFRSMWSLGKSQCFGVDSSLLSVEQKNIMLYSRMYDNVYENPDRPTDQVIEDDDMLDGWFALQRIESENERKKGEVDKLLGKKTEGKQGGKGELFVMANTQEEAQKMHDLNDLDTRVKLKQRKNVLAKAEGAIDEANLPDVKVELRQQAMKQMAEKMKGR